MMMIEISDSKVSKMGHCVEKILRAGGELMTMLDRLDGGEGYAERDSEYPHEGGHSRSMMHGGSYGSRYYGDRYYGERGMGYRDDDEWDEESMNERRRRSRRTGRYM